MANSSRVVFLRLLVRLLPGWKLPSGESEGEQEGNTCCLTAACLTAVWCCVSSQQNGSKWSLLAALVAALDILQVSGFMHLTVIWHSVVSFFITCYFCKQMMRSGTFGQWEGNIMWRREAIGSLFSVQGRCSQRGQDSDNWSLREASAAPGVKIQTLTKPAWHEASSSVCAEGFSNFNRF